MAPRRTTLLLATLAIWSVAWAVWTADVLVEPVPFALERAARRLPLCLAGAGLCMALGALLARIPAGQRALLAMTAVAGVIGCSLAFAVLNEIAFYLIVPRWGPPTAVHIPDVAMMDGWVFLAWTLLFFALASDAVRRERELALVRTEAAAVDAQHRLLVSQAQPHFLFNALNAIYALVLDANTKAAQEAILTLSSYLRRSLDDPDRTVTLGEELAFARDYLAIERIRFGDRLRVWEDVPATLLDLVVPSLLLQPLVENSVRHGLDGAPGPMTIMLAAAAESGCVRLTVADDGAGRGVPGGAGIGLASVERRLAATFGPAASVSAGAGAAGGYRVDLHFPARP